MAEKRWTDTDATFEGTFTISEDAGVWKLDANITATRFRWNGKTLQRTQVFVPSLTGVIRQKWQMFGRTFFRGLIDLPNAPVLRSDEVFGSYDETQGSVQINLFGNIFNIVGWLDHGLSGAEVSGSNVQSN